jgi:hypothetical protein
MFKVPLEWFLKNQEIDVYLVSEKQPILFLQDIIKKFNRNLSYQANAEFAKQTEALIVEIHDDLNVSVDISGYKCGPDDSEDNAIKFRVSFNTPLVIQNLTMMHLTVFEIDNPHWSEQTLKAISSIPAGMKDQLLQLDITPKNKSYMKF